jgi:serine/threonine protein phosphatase 1
MRTLCVGDCHGCGLELESLITEFNPSPNDIIISLGDLFDRGLHAQKVWELIHKYNIKCILGNHEVKMRKFLVGERSNVPKHYLYAIDQLLQIVTKKELLEFLYSMPEIVVENNYIAVHAGVDPQDPEGSDMSYCVYGKPITQEQTDWMKQYDGDKLIIFGHMGLFEVRNYINSKGNKNSICIDTSAVRGEALTGYEVETGKIYNIKSQADWFSIFKDMLTPQEYQNLETKIKSY